MIRHLAVLLVLLFSLASCSGGAGLPDEPTPPSEPGASLRLHISLGEQKSSRAPSEGEYDPGTDYENYIDLDGDDFFVALYSLNNKFLFIADNKTMTRDNAGLFSKTYTLTFPLTPEQYALIPAGEGLGTKSFKILLLANWGNYPTASEASATTLDKLFNSADGFAVDYSSSSGYPGPVLERKIPLFGVQEYSGVKVYDWMATSLNETIHLIRALAKVEVWLRSDANAELEYVKLTNCSTKAAPAPFGVTKRSDYVKNSYVGDYIATPSIPESNTFATDIELSPDKDGHYIIYISEFANIGGGKRLPDADCARLKVKLAGKDENGQPFKEKIIDFAYYRENPDTQLSYIDTSKGTGGYFDVLRNNWYKFELNRVASNLNLTVDVIPYRVINLDPVFGLD